MKTMTAKQLVITIAEMIKSGEIKEDTKILLSSDGEGNEFGTITKDSFGLDENNNLILYPYQQNYDIAELA